MNLRKRLKENAAHTVLEKFTINALSKTLIICSVAINNMEKVTLLLITSFQSKFIGSYFTGFEQEQNEITGYLITFSRREQFCYKRK